MSVKGEFLAMPSYVVMGMLSFGQRLTGYEIRQWALGSTRFFWAAPAMSQIYRQLERLEADGLVDQLDESDGSERARTTYGLTPNGIAELTRWVTDAPFVEPTIRHPAAFRLFLGHLATPDQLRSMLLEHRNWLDSVLADLEGVHADLDGDDRFTHAQQVAAWGLDFFGADRDGATQAANSLSD